MTALLLCGYWVIWLILPLKSLNHCWSATVEALPAWLLAPMVINCCLVEKIRCCVIINSTYVKMLWIALTHFFVLIQNSEYRCMSCKNAFSPNAVVVCHTWEWKFFTCYLKSQYRIWCHKVVVSNVVNVNTFPLLKQQYWIFSLCNESN